MPRRLPTLLLTAAVGLFALASILTAQPPAPPTAAKPTAAPSGDGIKRTQEENLKLYKRFADELLKLAQRWEKSDNPDEKERAKALRAALQIADKEGVENLFKGVINSLGNTKNPTGTDFNAMLARDAKLVKALEAILETLDTEDEIAKLTREIKDIKELKEKVEAIKREQENIEARTGLPKADADKIAKDQDKLGDKTKDLANNGKKGDPSKGDPNAKDGKSDPKPEAKPGDNNAEPKPDTKEDKSNDKPSAGTGDPMKDPKTADGKPMGGMPMPGDPKAGGDKESPKDPAGDPMAGKGMGDPNPPMPGDPKAGDPAKPMQGDSKAQGDGKGDSKPSDGMAGEGKPMPGGMPMDSPPGGGKPMPGGMPGDAGMPPPGGMPPPNATDQAKQDLDKVVPDQKGAADDLKKNDRPNASKKEADATKKLNDIIAELEKRLKQLREKEMLKKLEDLERRVAKMLKMQQEVYAATQTLDTVIKKNTGMKTNLDRQKAGIEADKEGSIAEEADKALRLLEGEGTAVVFAGVLSEAKKDMVAVRAQLNEVNVGEDTQLVERQIIEQLQRMLEALKKAKDDLQNPPMPPPPGEPPPPNDEKENLIKLVEQLKLLKSLQVQVNERTSAFGKRTHGEQAKDPFVGEQLKQLGERQKFLQDMLHKIAAEIAAKQ